MPFPLPNLLDGTANFTPHLIFGVSEILDQVLVNMEQKGKTNHKKISTLSYVITHSFNLAHPPYEENFTYTG